MLFNDLLRNDSAARKALDELCQSLIESARNALETAADDEILRFQADIRAARELRKHVLKAAEESKRERREPQDRVRVA